MDQVRPEIMDPQQPDSPVHHQTTAAGPNKAPASRFWLDKVSFFADLGGCARKCQTGCLRRHLKRVCLSVLRGNWWSFSCDDYILRY